MADAPLRTLAFDAGCPDCGERKVVLPEPLPAIGDDFDWQQRDYDSFRIAMLETLAARYPERGNRWHPADMEVVLVEAFAVVLDQLSDMLDRVHGEAFLETARQPQSVRRLLKLIGYEPLETSGLVFDATDPASVAAARAELDRQWLQFPQRMEAAKLDGPRSIHRRRRMVTAADHDEMLATHPLVERAHASPRWNGSWNALDVALVLHRNALLDTPFAAVALPAELDALRREIEGFHAYHSLQPPEWQANHTVRSLLNEFVRAYRMVGLDVVLQDARFVPLDIALSVRVRGNYFRSEVRDAVRAALGTDPGGFFEPGRLRFGEDVHQSDLVEVVMALDGVENLCINRFKRLGRRHPDQADAGRIVLEGIEMALCDADPVRPERGVLRISLEGGQVG